MGILSTLPMKILLVHQRNPCFRRAAFAATSFGSFPGPRSGSKGLHALSVSGRKRAFTLVELLVTIGIVALVASLLFPALGKLRQGAEQTKSISKLRQLTTARIAQIGDSDGKVILATWRQEILPYLNLPDAAGSFQNKWQDPRCLPLFQCKIWLSLYKLRPMDKVSSFSMNASPWNAAGGGNTDELLAVSARIPPRTIMLFHAVPADGGTSAHQGAFYSSAVPVLSGKIMTAPSNKEPYGKLLVSRYDGSVDVYEKTKDTSLANSEWTPF